MSTKAKSTTTKTKKENLETLPLPELWERFKAATGERTKSPNKRFLVRRIEEALAAEAKRTEGPPPAKLDKGAREPTTPATKIVTATASDAPKPPRGRFATMTIEELQTKYLEVVGRATGSDDRRYVEPADMGSREHAVA